MSLNTNIVTGQSGHAALHAEERLAINGLAAISSEGGAWSSATVYSAGSVVTYTGARYLTTTGTAASSYFNTAQWILLGAVPDTF